MTESNKTLLDTLKATAAAATGTAQPAAPEPSAPSLPELTPVIKHVFKCTQQSIRYIFKDGKNAAFFDYTYYTDVQKEIDELNEEINVGRNPMLYVDKNCVTVDMNTLDPLAEYKRQLKAEAQAEARVELLRDLGVTNGGDDMRAKLQGLSNTIRVGQGAAASNTTA